MRKAASPRLLIALCGLAASASSALSDIWDNSAGNAQWSTATNWADNTEPTSTDAAIFPAAIPLNQATILMTTTEFCSSLTFNNDYTLQGGQMFIIGGGVDVASGRTATINTVINGSAGLSKTGGGTLRLLPTSSNSFSGPISITGFSSTLYVRSNVALGNTANDITISGGRLILDGITNPTFLVTGRTITAGALGATIELQNNAFLDLTSALGPGSNPIWFTGSGTVELAGTSTRTGSTFVSVPLLRLNSANALGAPGSASLSNGVTLEINNGSGTFAGSVFTASGNTIRGGTGTHTFNGFCDAGSAIILNGGPTSSDKLILGSNGASVWNNGGTATTSVNVGTVELASVNNYTGGWSVGGTLQVNHPGSLGTGTTPVVVGSTGRFILNCPTFARDIALNRRLDGMQLLQSVTFSRHINLPAFGLNEIARPFLGAFDATLTGSSASLGSPNAVSLGDAEGRSVRVLAGATVSTGAVFLFGTPVSPGGITVSGTGSRWDCSDYFQIGQSSSATLLVDAGGAVSAETVFFGAFLDTNDDVSATVTGAGSTLTCTNTLWAGYSSFQTGGIATFSVLDSAHVTSGAGIVGAGASTTTATVSGSGSTWSVQNILEVAASQSSSATLNLSNGGSASCLGLALGNGAASSGSCTISGGLSRLDCGTSGVAMSQSGASSTLNLTGGIVDIRGNITDAGAGVSTFILDAATLDMHNFAIGAGPSPIDNLQFRSGTLKNVAQINNGAGLTKTGPGTLFFNTSNTYTGPTNIHEGTLFVVNSAGSATGPGLVTVAAGAVLAGPGIIGGLVQNDGVVAPAGFIGNSVGTLTVNGTYSQFATGSLRIDIESSASNDLLVVTGGGASVAAGTLDVQLVSGFSPALGDSFTILTAAFISGQFPTTNLPGLAVGLAWRVEYLSNAVRLVVVSDTCRADVNADGELNPDDLADYIGAYFANPPGSSSDFNADGETNPDDLADYIGAFFNGCG